MRALLLLVAACQPESSAPPDDACATCRLADANQFTYTSALSVVSLPLRSGVDAEIRWDDLEYDVHGHRFHPGDVDRAHLALFVDQSPGEVVLALEADSLPPSHAAAYPSCLPDGDACRLSQFEHVGQPARLDERFHPGAGTWLLVLTSRAERGAVALALLRPGGSSASVASLAEPSSRVGVKVDFTSLAPLRPRARVAETLLEWATVGRDGLGLPLREGAGSELFLGRYDEPREALEGSIFDLAEAAEESWSMALGGNDWANLAGLRGDSPFGGLTPGSTWLAAVLSDNSLVATPKVVTFLEPVPDR